MQISGKKKIITIHGINTDAPWQEDVKRVLEPHFECVSIKYDKYRRLGETKILFDPVVAVSGTVMSVFFRHGVTSLLAYLSATTAIAVLISVRRRIKTLREVKREFDGFNFTGRPPHVIAHSLGTYFIGSMIADFLDVRVDNMVLTGCVLKANTPWSKYISKNPKAVMKIRNEMAGKDFVARLAVIFYGFFPGLGHAGLKGFNDLAHTVEAHSGCGVECTSLVHNVNLDRLGHSSVFVGNGHAQRFWLPFFWNLDPHDYEQFVEMCLLADHFEGMGDIQRMGTVEEELRDKRWRWTNNFTLADYLKEIIEYLMREKGVKPIRPAVRKIRDLAVRKMWKIVALAYEAQMADVADPELTKKLHPQIAAMSAITSVDR